VAGQIEHEEKRRNRDDDGHDSGRRHDVPPSRDEPADDQKPGHDEVELFFNRELPGVQKWVEGCGSVEVARFFKKHQVGIGIDECCGPAGSRGASHRADRADHCAGGHDQNKHDRESGQEASDSALIKVSQSKATLSHPPSDGAGDHVSGDDEEDVYSGEPSGQGESGVENDDRQNGNGPNPLNVQAGVRAGLDELTARQVRRRQGSHELKSAGIGSPDAGRPRVCEAAACHRFRCST